MTRRSARDQRQAELFHLPESPPTPVKPARRPTRRLKEEPAADPAPEVTAEQVAARLTPPELEVLVRTLPDDKLAHVVMAATRDLKSRLERSGAQRRSRSAK